MADIYEIPLESVEYLKAQVDSDDDLETGSVWLGFAVPDGITRPSTWISGSWVSAEVNQARALKVAGSPAKGEYALWIRIQDSPEDIYRFVDIVRVI